MGLGEYRLISHDSAQTEISKLYIALAGYEHIAGFQISMKNSALFSTMALK